MRALIALLLLAPLTGCSMLRATISSYDVGPNGIARSQYQLREALGRADFPAALGFKEEDALLRALNTGVSSYYASQFARSAAVLDSAALLADDRITRSLTREGVALVTNDMMRAYQPRRTERLFIPYYAMLSYARLEQWEDAAVEARRLSALLARYAEDRAESEKPTHAALHHLAASVFERAGETVEAQVAYRLARALMPSAVDSMRASVASHGGEVLVVVERGFVAHRAIEGTSVFIEGDDNKDGYWLSVAVPTLRQMRRGEDIAANLLVDGACVESERVVGTLDDAARADEARERTGILARAVIRATAKYAISKAVKDKKGEVAGSIANIGASLLERADVRSWHLLPREITLVRVRVAEGRHHIQIALGNDAALVDAGVVHVRRGQVAIAAVRAW